MHLLAAALTLLIATREGELHRVTPAADAVEKDIHGAGALAADATHLAFSDGKQVVLRSGKKNVKLPEPGLGIHGMALSSNRVLLLRGDDVVELLADGTHRRVRGKGRAVAGTPDALFIARDGEVEQIDGPRWKTPGTPLAMAAEGDRIYVAVREGQLYAIERSKNTVVTLPLGSWWGTLAMVATGGKVYIVTQAGKIWEVDPATSPPAKHLWREAGWASAVAMTVDVH